MKKIAVLAVIIILGIAAYLVWGNNTTPAQTKEITISQAFEVFLYAPLYVAQEKGFFTDEGLKVNLITAGGDDKAFASLISGDAQFSVGDPTFAAVAGEKGQGGRIIGSILNGVPFWGIANKSSVPAIDTPTKLKGYKVATFPAPNTAYALQVKMFNTANLQPNIAQIAFGSLIPAVQAGDADIALELEPNVSTAVNNGFHIVYSLSEYYPDFAITGLMVLPSYIQTDSDTIQKVVNAIQKADHFIRNNPEQAADILAKRFPDVPKEVTINALKNIINANVIPNNLVVSENGWNTAIQLRKETGDIKGSALFSEYVVNSFAEKAK